MLILLATRNLQVYVYSYPENLANNQFGDLPQTRQYKVSIKWQCGTVRHMYICVQQLLVNCNLAINRQIAQKYCKNFQTYGNALGHVHTSLLALALNSR